VIFATCGSSHLPFERMMQALVALPADELYVQHGPASPPACATATPYLSFGEMLEQIERADVVVSHAGVGSIMCALRAGHVPVIFPRLKRYAETVDDHQAELARALAERGTAVVAWSPEDLAQAVRSIPPRAVARTLAAEGLSAAVRAAVRGEAVTALPR
jgi:UDP-N-acetylglucosamine--N-acetylmuramyl-(pentapeptide) pyrophosphoryl-undecaprenol N-acetylglucosamine transferase